MGENSSIQWTTHTFSPWVGCQRVSPGCEHCYAESYDRRVGGVPKKQRADPAVPETRWGPKGRRTRTSVSNWNQPEKWNEAARRAEDSALGNGRPAPERPRVFCASLADVFEDRPELAPWRLELLEMIRTTPHLDWLLLTKRPEQIRPALQAARDSFRTSTPLDTWLCSWLDHHRPPANVWLGTTVEDQQRADERIPALLDVPARVRFLSCEPLLERVDLDRHGLLWRDCSRCKGSMSLPVTGGGRACPDCLEHQGVERAGIDWVIIGGESGGGARPFALEWARDLVRQCKDSGTAVFVKQLGAVPVDITGTTGRFRTHEGRRQMQVVATRIRLNDPAGGDMAEWPEDLRVREFPR
ncbi:MAG: DUF5131 family protein [Myxococcaceae bacterium]|nr:DUF5131 family protein [Myxococcaceae bacterium]